MSFISSLFLKHFFKVQLMELYTSINTAACCFEQILGVVTYKTAAVWLPSVHLTNHLCKTNQTCWPLLEK